MSVTLWMPRERFAAGDDVSGMSVTWTDARQLLEFDGWYEHFVHLQGDSMTLREFFDALMITEQDCKRAWKEPKNL